MRPYETVARASRAHRSTPECGSKSAMLGIGSPSMLAAGHRRVHNRLYASSGYVVGAVMRRVLRRRHRSRLARETRSKYTDGTCTSIGFAL